MSDCKPGDIPCFNDCCPRGTHFCNHNIKQQRCFPCDTRVVYCNNETMRPPECDLFCFKRDNKQDIRDYQIYVTLTYVFGALLGVALLFSAGYIIWMIKTQKRRGKTGVSKEGEENKRTDSDESLLTSDADDNGGENNDDVENTSPVDDENASEVVQLRDPQSCGHPAGNAACGATTLIRAQPWDQLETSHAPPTLTPKQPSDNTVVNQIAQEDMQLPAQPRNNGPTMDNGPMDYPHVCRDLRLTNISPSTNDTSRSELAL